MELIRKLNWTLFVLLMIVCSRANAQVVITEIFPDPKNVAEPDGEWFELYNLSSDAVDLDGWTVTDGEGSFVIGGFLLPPGEFAVFATGTAGGQLLVDYIYPHCEEVGCFGMALDNPGDSVELRNVNNETIAYFAYSETTNNSGLSYSLNCVDDDPSDPAHWTLGASSPGEASPACAIDVEIDIRPGSEKNVINLASAGVVPVAILSSADFDAPSELNLDTISLAGATVKMVGKSDKALCRTRDVNGDGLQDVECNVLTVEFLIEDGQSIALLEAETLDGVPVRGEDTVTVVP